jgi:hypothetical protein
MEFSVNNKCIQIITYIYVGDAQVLINKQSEAARSQR